MCLPRDCQHYLPSGKWLNEMKWNELHLIKLYFYLIWFSISSCDHHCGRLSPVVTVKLADETGSGQQGRVLSFSYFFPGNVLEKWTLLLWKVNSQGCGLTPPSPTCFIGSHPRWTLGAHSSKEGDPKAGHREHQEPSSESTTKTSCRDA